MGQVMPAGSDAVPVLHEGRVLQHRRLATYNCTYLVEMADGEDRRCLAIYKPRDGEVPLWDFPHHTLYRRERLAYVVSEALGWGLVPLTIIRDGPFGVGAFQLFIHAQRGRHYFNCLQECRDQMVRIAVFDCVINNCDRKGGHCLLDEQGKIWAIDHGLSFTPGPKVRTVMWDLEEDALSDEHRASVAALAADTALREALTEHLAGQEVEAFYERVGLLKASDTMPFARLCDPYRPVPWPHI